MSQLNKELSTAFDKPFDEVREDYLNISLLHNEMLYKTKWVESLNNWMKEQLKLVTPPIKGEVTKGKLKWRGVELCCTNSIPTYGMSSNPITFTKYWIEQRGRKIGEEYVINFNANIK